MYFLYPVVSQLGHYAIYIIYVLRLFMTVIACEGASNSYKVCFTSLGGVVCSPAKLY